MGLWWYATALALILRSCYAVDFDAKDSTGDATGSSLDQPTAPTVPGIGDSIPGEDGDDDDDDDDEDAGRLDGLAPVDKNPRFCNKTTTFNLKTECKPCAMNFLASCPSGLRQLTLGRGVPDCTFAQRLDFTSVIYLAGCRHTCEKTATIVLCCPGFWGQDCQECPGGFQTPCTGRGRCLDGFYNNGTCICQAGFMGVACDQCKANLYGPQCNKACRCMNGVCNSGTNGTGSCDCNSGYKGTFCDESIVDCNTYSCPNNSRCVDSSDAIKCVCNRGFKEDADGVCQPINRCLTDPCHTQALCFPTGPNTFECSCMMGYDGDGFTCAVNDPCQKDFGGCPVDSTSCTFAGPGQRRCECLEGYENYVEDGGCQLIDACAINRTLCHEHANCTTTGPWEVECVCETGYIGDGQDCYGNIYERIKALHTSESEFKGRFQYAVQLTSSTYTDAFTQHGPFTLFLATDEGVTKSLTTRELQDVFGDKDVARQLVRQHVISAQLTLAELTNASAFYMLEGSSAELFYKNRELKFRLHDFSLRANVIKGDLIAANGIIHIIDQLLDKPPVTVGSTKKSIAYLLSSQPKYSRFYNLLKAVNLTEKLNMDGHYTVFAPSAISWSSLPQGTFDYFLSKEGKGKLIEILENHIVSGPYILASDLINLPQFSSMGGLANAVAVSSVGRIQFNNEVNLTQADIPASNGYIHNIDGILLPEALRPILPHRCDLVTYRAVRGTCGMCSGELKCPWTTDVPLNDTNPGCRYWVNLGDGKVQNFVAFSGCHQMCNRTYTVVRCCAGFYGSTCHPCPGGFQNPCLGRGKCKDGYYGNGECLCDPLYTGAECEFCANKGMYGPFCNSTCSCLHGRCDNRISGSVGQCKPYSCNVNYTGPNCDSQVQFCDKKMRLKCHAFADCIRQDLKATISDLIGKIGERSGEAGGFFQSLNRKKLRDLKKSFQRRSSCRCRQGYSGTGTYCTEINPCMESDRGGCHAQADCIKTSPGQVLCRCTHGWVGDGTYCYPSSACENDSHCHENALCVMTLSGQYACSCMDDYHGNGTYCVPENICSTNNGGCHSNASCMAAGPGIANCTCDNGLGGDGYICYGSIGYELRVESQLEHFNRFLQGLQKANNPLSNLGFNYTLLVPSQQALAVFLNSTSAAFWTEERNLQMMLSYHVLSSVMSLSDLRSQCQGQRLATLSDEDNFELRCSIKEEDIYFNDARVIAGDNPALNGLIHIIDKVLEPYTKTDLTSELDEALDKWPEFSDFSSSLSETSVMDEFESMGNITLFVPVSSDWETPSASRALKYYAVPSKLSTWKLRTLNGQRLATVLGGSVQQQIMVAVVDDKLYVNSLEIIEPKNIAIANGFIHAINGTFKPILNRCDILSSDQQLEEQCCSGYFGINCDECPGGVEQPCNDHGTCSDGIEGLGICQCDLGYEGDECSDCVEESCRLDACKFNNGGCDENAYCDVMDYGSTFCTCQPGYTGDGSSCQSICDNGYNGDCPSKAKCSLSEYGDVICMCPEGYELIDNLCIYTANDCFISNGGCSYRANCTEPDESGNVTCACEEGYAGDGYSCFGSLWQTLSELSEVSNFFQLLQDEELLTDSLQYPDSNFTAFVPVNKYMMLTDNLTQQDMEDFFVNETVFYFDTVLLDNDVVLQAINNEELHVSAVQDDDEELFYFVNGVAVVRDNIQLTNGVLHLIERPFYHASIHEPSIGSLQGETQHTRAWIVALLLVGIAVSILLFVVALWKKESLRIRITKLIPASHFPFHRFSEPSHSQPFDVITFNPAVDYEQEDGDVNANREELFPEMQQTGRDDQQQLL